MSTIPTKKAITFKEPFYLAHNTREQAIESVIKAIRITHQALQAHSQSVEKEYSVSAAHLWAMWELFRFPGSTVSDLAAALIIHNSTASNMLDKLEKKMLVRRERAGLDKRVVRLYLTSTGLELLATAPRPAQGPVTDALARLPDISLRWLVVELGRLIDALKVEHGGGAVPTTQS